MSLRGDHACELASQKARRDSSVMATQPVGTVTLLFSDIEGSTRLLEGLGRERYAEALTLHRRLLRGAFEQHGGYEVDNEGDAFFVAFSRAEDAVVAAASAQHALTAADWPEEQEFRVRMGIHTGEPLPVPPKYVGLDVHRAARIMAAGHGGQVLLSQTTRDLLDDRFAVRDLGEHRLKDLSAAQRLYQLQIDGVTQEFPALKTLQNRPTNLPVQLTPLIGRDRELREVARLLREEGVRLLTLTGAGGTGKTRLALQAAADTVEVFRDGVFFVSLAPIRDRELVLPTVAQALALREVPGEPISKTLASYLAEKQMLLVLDNFEQVLDAAGDVAELPARCPRLSLLVTSRERLRVAGERVFAVSPLQLPDEQGHLGSVAANEAVALFAARAAEATGEFALNAENAATVAVICRRLDGLPLAIELAAARTASLPPAALLQRLDHSLKLLTGGRRDAEERQRTLRATIEWSYDLLDPAEQALFARLSVFVDGCLIEAADRVGDPDSSLGIDILDGLDSLVEKNLVRQRADPADEPRYWMLETIREYARDRLNDSGERDDAHSRHAYYYLDLAERAKPELTSEKQLVWLRRIHGDLDNLRLAFRWFGESGAVDEALRLATAVWRALWLRGYLSEGRRWLRSALAGGEASSERVRIEALRAAAGLAHWQGDDGDESALAEEALALARRSGHEADLAGALLSTGQAAISLSDFERAEQLLQESMELARERGETRAICMALGSLGTLHRTAGRPGRARELWQESLPLIRAVGDRYGTAIILFGLAFVAIEEGQPDAAPPILVEALQLARELDYREGIAYFLEGAAAVAASRGDPERAATMLGRMRALHAELKFKANADDERLNAQTAEAARAALGERKFAAALEAGEDMSVEQALAYAIEDHRVASGRESVSAKGSRS
jgi:predicted ATPase/class 3 adenylate cyclase